MRKVKSTFFNSLDGVVESPDKWHFPYFNDEMGAAIGAGSASMDAYLMGRVLYEEWGPLLARARRPALRRRAQLDQEVRRLRHPDQRGAGELRDPQRRRRVQGRRAQSAGKR